MLDNLTVNGNGQALLQEDPGGQEYLAKVRLYDSATDTQTAVAKHDPDRFQTGGSKFVTNNEESSGIIGAARVLGKGWYLADVQAHRANPDPELVEEGQLLALKIPAGQVRPRPGRRVAQAHEQGPGPSCGGPRPLGRLVILPGRHAKDEDPLRRQEALQEDGRRQDPRPSRLLEPHPREEVA